jgi:hypothetical protein
MAMLTGHTEQSSKLYLSGLPRSARNQMGFGEIMMQITIVAVN